MARLEEMVPLDDLVLPEECACEFMPYPEEDGDFKESWHYLRRCRDCKTVFWSLHCPHEGTRECGACKQKNRNPWER